MHARASIVKVDRPEAEAPRRSPKLEPVRRLTTRVVSRFETATLTVFQCLSVPTFETQVQTFRGRDPREIPSYPLARVARYLRVPGTTLRSWVLGRPYAAGGVTRQWPSLIRIADPANGLLSFTNVVELFVLDALRRRFELKLPKVRRAIRYLEQQIGKSHPLATENMETDGSSLFVTYLGQLVNVSEEGQHAMRELLSVYLKRVEYDKAGLALSIYPFVARVGEDNQPRRIMINPLYASGRPVIAQTEIRTEIVSERFSAGESIPDLSEDYDRPQADIEDAIRYERAA